MAPRDKIPQNYPPRGVRSPKASKTKISAKLRPSRGPEAQRPPKTKFHKITPPGRSGGPKAPKTKFRKITPLEGSGGPQAPQNKIPHNCAPRGVREPPKGPPKQNSAKLRPSRGPEAPQDKIPQNYAPRGVRRPPKIKFRKITPLEGSGGPRRLTRRLTHITHFARLCTPPFPGPGTPQNGGC